MCGRFPSELFRKVWRAALDDFRNWVGLGLEAREMEMKIVGIGQNAVLGAARSRLTMEPSRPSNCVIRSVRD
jgi:hypothetical protein